jgi:hypothetical protein
MLWRIILAEGVGGGGAVKITVETENVVNYNLLKSKLPQSCLKNL